MEASYAVEVVKAGVAAEVGARELTPELLTAAQGCAEGVARAIRAGDYWPPVEIEPRGDDFASLFHRGTAESVAWKEAR